MRGISLLVGCGRLRVVLFAGAALLCGCASPRVVRIDAPSLASVENPYAKRPLYLTEFLVRNRGRRDKDKDIDALRQQFVEYLRTRGRFHPVVDATRPAGFTFTQGIPDGPDVLTMEVSVRLAINDTRTFRHHLAALPGYYPMVGYWPYSPQKGIVEVHAESYIFDPKHKLLAKAVLTATEPYSYALYGWYRTAPVQEAFKNAYQRAFDCISTPWIECSDEVDPPIARAPAPKPVPVEETVEVVSRVPDISVKTKLEDDGGDLILDGGERVSLSVTVENKGRSEAVSVRVALSGTAEIVAALGAVRELKGIRPGASATATFRARLPRDLPSQAAELRVEVLSGQNVSAGAKTLRVAMRQASKPEAVEVLSEVDVDDIPPRVRTGAGKQNAALIIGISAYRDKSIPAVRYARKDAEVTAKYLEALGGIAPENIKVLTDETATKSDIESYISDWLPRRVDKDSTVFIYFAGHGSPGPSGDESFLVPYEGRPDFPSQLVPLRQLYTSLEKLSAKQVVVMLDSCFSGAKGRSVVGAGTRPLVATMRGPQAGGRLTVLAGATGAQTTSDLDRAKHGLFTYYMLRGMRGEADADDDGAVVLGELYDFVRGQVAREASVTFNRDQTPVLLPPQGGDDRLKVFVSRNK